MDITMTITMPIRHPLFTGEKLYAEHRELLMDIRTPLFTGEKLYAEQRELLILITNSHY